MSIAFTGLGLWTALGRGVPAHREALAQGRSGQAPAPDLAPDETGPPPWAARIDRGQRLEQPGLVDLAALALAAAREAVADAGPAPQHARVGLIFGCATGALARRADAHEAGSAAARAIFAESLCTSVADAIARGLGLEGPRLVISTACTSSLQAIVLGRALLEAGLLDRVVAGGAELIAPATFAGFRRLGATSPGPCCPFSTPRGMALGEGAGFVVLERGADLAARGREARGWLLGAGGSAETWHATAPHPRGLGMIASMQRALADADISAAEVGYLDAQGTGTDANDLAEALAISAVFGDVPVGATKSLVGHTLGAAGAVETILALLALQRGKLSSIAGFQQPRRIAPAGLLTGPGERPTTASIAVKNTAAFGGVNATLVLGTAPGRRVPPLAAPLVIRSSLLLSPAGLGLPLAPVHGSISAEILAELADPRTLARDRVGGVLGAAVGLALRRAGEPAEILPGARLGLVCGVSAWPGQAGVSYYRESQRTDGPIGGARDFTGTVRNAPAGSACRQQGLEGPGLTLACGPGGGISVLVCAALLLRDTPGLEGLVVAGIDERVSDERRWTRGTESGSVEAAAAAVLGRHGASEPQIIGLGLGASSVAGVVGAIGSACPLGRPGPDLLLIEGGLPDLDVALEQAGFTDIPRIYLTIRLGPIEGSAGPAALALAVEALASGAQRVLLLGVGELVGASTLLVAAATTQQWTQRSSA